MEELATTKRVLVDLLSKDIGQPRECIEQDMERDFWMNANEAQSYGLVDGISRERKVKE